MIPQVKFTGNSEEFEQTWRYKDKNLYFSSFLDNDVLMVLFHSSPLLTTEEKLIVKQMTKSGTLITKEEFDRKYLEDCVLEE